LTLLKKLLNSLKIIGKTFGFLDIFWYLCRVKEITINPIYSPLKHTTIMKKNTIWEVLLRIVIAAATAALTALGTTACMGV